MCLHISVETLLIAALVELLKLYHLYISHSRHLEFCGWGGGRGRSLNQFVPLIDVH